MEKRIRKTLDEYLEAYIPMQEIIYVSEKIIESPTEKTLHEMLDYLMQFDKEFVYLQTVDVKSIINNQARLCMAKIAEIIGVTGEEESPI